ncbi:MAG: P-II family nitrogen regulator [Actinomycetota bacterium]|jgi:nitrogen regulatory protein P-II 1|nr:P-II family nitrogen regulator [Actinomycetota bacterium]
MQHLITTIIKPHALDGVKEAIKASGSSGMTVTDVSGFGRQGGHSETYRGAEYQVEFLPKLKVEVVVSSEDADRVAREIQKAASTGSIGDGKIWVTTIDRLMRIRTGEMGDDAL